MLGGVALTQPTKLELGRLGKLRATQQILGAEQRLGVLGDVALTQPTPIYGIIL